MTIVGFVNLKSVDVEDVKNKRLIIFKTSFDLIINGFLLRF